MKNGIQAYRRMHLLSFADIARLSELTHTGLNLLIPNVVSTGIKASKDPKMVST